jgi:hypothetical protein
MPGTGRTVIMVGLVLVGLALLIKRGFPPPDELKKMRKPDVLYLGLVFSLILVGILIKIL